MLQHKFILQVKYVLNNTDVIHSSSLSSTDRLSYLGRDAWKPALQEDQVLFLALALHLCGSLSVVLSLYPGGGKKKKKGAIYTPA